MAACSTTSTRSSASPSTTVFNAKSLPASPTHPTVDVSTTKFGPIPAGKGVPQASATVEHAGEGGPAPVLVASYAESEELVSGTAATYSGPATGPVTPQPGSSHFVTRILVRAPKDKRQFSGRVLVEPFNTSGGAELDALWQQVGPMLMSEGDAWVGVTERASSVGHLQSYDPVRYAALDVPTNDVAWDILRQVGRVLKDNLPTSPLRGLDVTHLYMGGYSQSALDTATFAMAFQPRTGTAHRTPVYDGYLPAAHSGSVTPVQSGTAVVPTLESKPFAPVDVPVIDIETQTDVEGFAIGSVFTSTSGASVRRHDSNLPADRYRLYEIPGAPHASTIDGCDGRPSSFPTEMFLRAAFKSLTQWEERSTTPPSAPRIELAVDDAVAVSKLDDFGNALGGVRSPFVDVPLYRYDVHSETGPLCKLAGHETPISAANLEAKYGSAARYRKQFTASLDQTIKAGFLRVEDRSELLQLGTSGLAAKFS